MNSLQIYGTRSAPFIDSRVINQLIIYEGQRFPLAIEPMTKGRYVDDISGASDVPDQLICIAQQLIDLFNLGGFRLAKWKSNLPSLLTTISHAQFSNSEHSFNSESIKVLCLNWSPT